MIKNIIFSLIFVCLLFAIALKSFGVDQVTLGPAFMSFVRSTSIELESFKIEIPKIPSIPYLEDLGGIGLLLNAFITFVNGLSLVINFVITILNVIIQVLQFLFLILKNLITLRDTLVEQSSSI